MNELCHTLQYHSSRVSIVDEFDSDILFDILGVDQVILVMVVVKVKARVSQRPDVPLL